MLLTLKLVLIILILLTYTLHNAFYVAIGQLSESEIRESAEQGDKKADRVLKYIDNEKGELDRVASLKSFLALLLAGFTVLVFSTNMRVALCHLFSASTHIESLIYNCIGGLLIICITAFALYIFGEVFAKILGIRHSKSVSKKLLNYIGFSVAVIKPAAVVLEFIWQKFSDVFGTNPDFDEEVTEEGILQMVDDAEESGVLAEDQKEIINNLFEFDDISVYDVMNHRTDIVAVDISEKLDAVLKTAIEEGFSRIPVFEDDLDNIVGIIYVKDLLKYVGKKLPERVSLRSVMREAYHIPQTKRCSELFKEFTERHIQMAIVIDEYGGTAGIVTLEDLIEAILGNIQDEYDDEEEEIRKLNETTFRIDGTCDIEEVEDMLGISFPEGDFDTLGGFMLYSLGRIPKDNERPFIEEKGYKFTAISIKERRIEVVKAEKLPEPSEEESED
ncbi:MAG: hemolysin family protein [Acutalibacteraceae bacterium]